MTAEELQAEITRLTDENTALRAQLADALEKLTTLQTFTNTIKGVHGHVIDTAIEEVATATSEIQDTLN